MLENRVRTGEPRDYTERFEFKFTVGNNIICQRYFRINNFNPLSLSSLELANTIRECANIIDNDLKDKTAKYLEIVAPRVFNSLQEMEDYYADGKDRGMRLGEGIVVKNCPNNYVWGKKGEPVVVKEKFDNGEFSAELSEADIVDYKFAFYDSGREVCSTTWQGVYPKFVRNSIDLSNKRGKVAEEDVPKLGAESYLMYKMVEGKSDIVYKIIKEICFTCSSTDNSWYTTVQHYADDKGKITKYDNTELPRELRKEYKRLESYEQGYR